MLADGTGVFGSKLIEGLEVGLIPILFLVIHSLEAVDNVAFYFSSSTSLNWVLWTGDYSISWVVPIGSEIHDVIL